jgi:hypothetical protein
MPLARPFRDNAPPSQTLAFFDPRVGWLASEPYSDSLLLLLSISRTCGEDVAYVRALVCACGPGSASRWFPLLLLILFPGTYVSIVRSSPFFLACLGPGELSPLPSPPAHARKRERAGRSDIAMEDVEKTSYGNPPHLYMFVRYSFIHPSLRASTPRHRPALPYLSMARNDKNSSSTRTDCAR